MNLSAYQFKPMSGRTISFCLLIMIICQCLLPATVLPADREDFSTVTVPDVRHKTQAEAEAIIKRKYLTVGNISMVTSKESPGTVVEQDPGAGTRTKMGSRVNIRIAQPPPTPLPHADIIFPPDRIHGIPTPTGKLLQAEISPSTLTVKQGEPAFFESRSTPRESIESEAWAGPLCQEATGQRFEVRTKGLAPGRYVVKLEVTHKQDQKDSAHAILEVTAPQPYKANIRPSRTTVKQSQPVIFTVSLTPERKDVTFLFHFGDDARLELRNYPTMQTTHKYLSAGRFKVFVQVLSKHEVIATSDPIFIEVSHASLWLLWLGIGAAFVAGFGGGYYLFTRKQLRIVPRTDSGTQNMDGEMSRFRGPEICLMPIADGGRQEIVELQDPFIKEERREK